VIFVIIFIKYLNLSTLNIMDNELDSPSVVDDNMGSKLNDSNLYNKSDENNQESKSNSQSLKNTSNNIQSLLSYQQRGIG